MPKSIKLKMKGGGGMSVPRMRGGFNPQYGGAPSSFFDSPAFTNLLILILLGVLGFIVYHIYKIYYSGTSIAPTVQQYQQPPVNVTVEASNNGDDRYAMPPKPLRFWRAPPDTSVWNPTTLPTVSTRGLPEQYQTIGLLKYPGGELKPLLGRRTAGSNDRWNYYTRTDTYNPVPVPLKQGRRDCMEDTGCNEVFDGDKLKSLNGEEVGITLYKMNGPTYISGI
jgi:hypothetical protein